MSCRQVHEGAHGPAVNQDDELSNMLILDPGEEGSNAIRATESTIGPTG
jgi:hypothetical protein